MAPTFIANNPDTEQCAQLEVGTGYASPYRTPPIYTQNKTPSTFPVHAEDFYCKTQYRGKGVHGCGRRFGCCGCGWGPARASNDSGALESICVCVWWVPVCKRSACRTKVLKYGKNVRDMLPRFTRWASPGPCLTFNGRACLGKVLLLLIKCIIQ